MANFDDQITDVLKQFANYIEKVTDLQYVDVNFYSSESQDVRCLVVYEGSGPSETGSRHMLDVTIKVRITADAGRADMVLRYTQNIINSVDKERKHDIVKIGDTVRNGDLSGNTSDPFETETEFTLCSLVGQA